MKFEHSTWAAVLGASSVLASPSKPAPSPCATDNSGDFKSKCASYASRLAIDKGKVKFTDFIAAGTNLTLPGNDPTCAQSSVIVPADICRIGMSVATSQRSEIIMETWLPSNWTGRFLSAGNGGLGGCIKYDDLAYSTGLGFSAVCTNNGHNGTSGKPFLNNSDVVEDFAYRAMHTGVVVGKQVSKAFYGKTHTKSYYLGCSTGGRQGFKSAQDFPDDFDGIIAGAPALAFSNLTSWSSSFYPITGPPGSETFLTTPQWVTVHKDVLKQCDGLDGSVDGIIEDTLKCQYDPSGLLCPAGTTNSTTCLTATQINTVKTALSPLRDAQGSFIFPRLQPGAEIGASAILVNGVPFFSGDWFEYALYNDPSWDPRKINSTDYDNSARLNPFNIMTWKGDLSAVKNRGAKILHWHGNADFIITSENSPRYYEHVSKTMALSPAQLDEFYRFFVVSGTGHCSGGDGANVIGQGSATSNSLNPKENILMALVQWVEKGQAPDTILGTHWVNNTQSLGVDFQRAHCRYPRHNQYKGTGNPKLPENWECINEKRW